MELRKTGNWAFAAKMVTGEANRFRGVLQTVLRQEAELLRKEIVQGLTKQAPDGKKFRPLSQLTLAARRLRRFHGTKALMVRGDLRNNISAIVRGEEAFIGVHRKAKDKAGKPVIDIAKLNEYGSNPIVIPVTPKLRRFLAALYREAGIPSRKSSGKGVVVTRIPPRPFLRPAFERFSRGAEKRVFETLAKALGGMGS